MLFQKRLSYYLENPFSYQITSEHDVFLFREYRNNQEIQSLTLSSLAIELLHLLDHKIYSFEEVHSTVHKKHNEVSETVLKTAIVDLKSECLVYTNNTFSEMTSVISF